MTDPRLRIQPVWRYRHTRYPSWSDPRPSGVERGSGLRTLMQTIAASAGLGAAAGCSDSSPGPQAKMWNWVTDGGSGFPRGGVIAYGTGTIRAQQTPLSGAKLQAELHKIVDEVMREEGLSTVEHLHESADVRVMLDGYDEKAKIGFEFVDPEFPRGIPEVVYARDVASSDYEAAGARREDLGLAALLAVRYLRDDARPDLGSPQELDAQCDRILETVAAIEGELAKRPPGFGARVVEALRRETAPEIQSGLDSLRAMPFEPGNAAGSTTDNPAKPEDALTAREVVLLHEQAPRSGVRILAVCDFDPETDYTGWGPSGISEASALASVREQVREFVRWARSQGMQ